MSAVAVFIISLIGAHLPPPLMKILLFSIGLAVVCGVAMQKCAEIAGTPTPSRRMRTIAAAGLILAGFAHTYWIIFDRYLDEARKAIQEMAESQREREQIANAITSHAEQLDEAGLATLLQAPPALPTFFDYLRLRLTSDRLPAFIKTDPWPIAVFALEIAIAVMLGCWFAVEGTPLAGKAAGSTDHSPA